MKSDIEPHNSTEAMPINTPHMNSISSAAMMLRRGKKVILREDWENPERRGLRFHKGTLGEIVDTEVSGGEVSVLMRFPHQPPMTARFPISLLEPA